MPCYHPIQAWRANTGRSKTGAWPIVFNKKDGYVDMPVTVPCGKCIGCRLEYSRQWAIRCVHESKMHNDNCFITLTYNDNKLPVFVDENQVEYPTLYKKDFQDFMKRLRKRTGVQMRYFHCGEYGTLGLRPHYHACLFGYDFADKVLWKAREGVRLYVSDELNDVWGNGYTTVGEVTFESAAYVARYIMKKQLGKSAKNYYQELQPEYTTMSRKPGLARNFFDKYHGEMYNNDSIIINKKELKPPKYYDKLFDGIDHLEMEEIKRKRKALAELNAADNTPDRLEVKENLVKLSMKKFIRPVERIDYDLSISCD